MVRGPSFPSTVQPSTPILRQHLLRARHFRAVGDHGLGRRGRKRRDARLCGCGGAWSFTDGNIERQRRGQAGAHARCALAGLRPTRKWRVTTPTACPHSGTRRQDRRRPNGLRTDGGCARRPGRGAGGEKLPGGKGRDGQNQCTTQRQQRQLERVHLQLHPHQQ